jgi:hypothetical protein
MPGERNKERVLNRYQTGVVVDESHGGSFYKCHMVDNSCNEETVGRINYGVGAKFNLCHHQKDRTLTGIPAVCSEYTQRLIRYTGGRFYPTPSMPTYEILDSRLEIQRVTAYREIAVTSEEIELKRYDALNKLIHLVPDQHMNVLRSAMELKDTKATITGVIDFIKWCQSQIGKVVVLKGVARRLSLLTNVVVFAEAYLTYQFGIAPTVSDVKQFLRELSEGKLRVKGNRTIAGYHKGQVVVARYVASPTLDQVGAEMFYDTHSGEASGTRAVRLYTGTSYIEVPLSGPADGWSRAAEVRVRRETGCYFAELNRDLEISGLEELKRRWEWNCPSFKTLWDLCPFSFLVDWLVDVGKFIERLEKRYLSPNYRRYLGPIWWARTRQERVYRPALDRFTVEVESAQPPDDPGNGGILNLRWHWKAHPHLVSQAEVFDRGPVTSEPTAVWPEIGQRVSAYQISTGMALLASSYKGLANLR